jgi:hypothetical protein
MIKKLVLGCIVAFGAELSAMNCAPSVPVGLPKKVTYPLGIAAGVYGTYKLRQHLQGDPQMPPTGFLEGALTYFLKRYILWIPYLKSDIRLIKAWSKYSIAFAQSVDLKNLGLTNKNIQTYKAYEEELKNSQNQEAIVPSLVIYGDIELFKSAIAEFTAMRVISRKWLKIAGKPLAKVEISTLMSMSPVYREQVLKEVIAWASYNKGFVFINGIERLNPTKTTTEAEAQEYTVLRKLIFQPSKDWQLIVGASETLTPMLKGLERPCIIDMLNLEPEARQNFLRRFVVREILSKAVAQSLLQRLNIFKKYELKLKPDFSVESYIVDLANRMEGFSAGDIQKYIQNVLKALLKQEDKIISKHIFEEELDAMIRQKTKQSHHKKLEGDLGEL